MISFFVILSSFYSYPCTYLLDNVEVSRSCTSDVNEDRLDQNVLGEVLELLRHGGREEERLPLLLEVVHDLLYLRVFFVFLFSGK